MSRIAWFSSETGRKFMGVFTLTTGSAIFLSNFLPHTFCLKYYQEFVQMYRNGLPVPVPKKVLAAAETVMKDMKISETLQPNIKFFTPYGFDLFLAGSTLQHTGVIIGLPISFSYETLDSINKSEIKVNNEDVQWDKEEAQNLLNSLILSADGQKFAIARQLHMCQTPYVLLQSMYPTCVVLSIYSIAYRLNRKLQLFQRPLVIRGCFYVILGLFGLGTWALLKDATTVRFEMEADKNAAALGTNYLNGGIEFYNKILQRNISLRSLMGKSGWRRFTAYGNDEVVLRQKHTPFTARKDALQKLKEMLKDENVNIIEAEQ